MRRVWQRVGDERGVALILALMILLTLTALVLAFVAVSGLEPQIARNHSDSTRARYLAEAGIEMAYNWLNSNVDATYSYSTALNNAAAAVANDVTPAPAATVQSVNGVAFRVLGGLSRTALPGVAANAGGVFTVMFRNDSDANDQTITGLAPEVGAPTGDANRAIIVRSVGMFNGASRTLEVVVRRIALPPFPGAVNIPGLQSDSYINRQTFDIDGRDYACSANCDTPGNWTLTTNPMKYGIATQPGTQAALGVSYEQNVENAISTSGSCNSNCATNKVNSIKGRDQNCASNCTDPATFSATNATAPTSGNPTPVANRGTRTIVADSSLTPTLMNSFLTQVANAPGAVILQSTLSCPMVMTGAATATNVVTVNNGCSGSAGYNASVNLGDRDNPKLVYFRGDHDPTSGFTGLRLNSGIKGAGILVIEDGDLKNYGSFAWDGVVIVTGKYVSSAFMTGSNTAIRGALVAMESRSDEAGGYFDFYLDGTASSFSVRASKQNIDMAQSFLRGLQSLSNWREI
jgi:Tfp pilus assembly protein PilX